MKIALFSWTVYNVFFMTSTMIVSAIQNQPEEIDGWINRLLGPLGALALSLLAVYIMYRFILHQRLKNEELTKKLLEEKDKEIDSLKKQVEKLIDKLN